MGTGDHIWNQTKLKIDKVAEAVAMMEEGQFEFPDGKPRFANEDGMKVHRVVRKDAMHYADYARESQQAYTNIFNADGKWHGYFTERLNWHRQRISGGFRKALAELTDDGSALNTMSAKLFESLMYELNDPELAKKIPFRERAALYRDVTKLAAQVKGESETRHKPQVTQPSVMVGIINKLPEGVAKKAQDKLEVIEGELAESE